MAVKHRRACCLGAAALLISVSMAAEAGHPPKSKAGNAAKSRKTKAAVLSQLISRAMDHGKDVKVEAPMTTDVGLDSEVPAKALYYNHKEDSRSVEHSLYVVYQVGEDREPIPADLLWNRLEIAYRGEKKIYAQWSYRSTIEGRLLRVAHVEGDEDNLLETQPEITEDVRRAFEREKRYFLTVSRDRPADL